jgi:hypothetical protein
MGGHCKLKIEASLQRNQGSWFSLELYELQNHEFQKNDDANMLSLISSTMHGHKEPCKCWYISI